MLIFIIIKNSISRDKNVIKIMLPMLKLDTNYGFRELFNKPTYKNNNKTIVQCEFKTI
jgi:hypothetical protein